MRQSPGGLQEHVEIGHLVGRVVPYTADRTAVVDQERRAPRDVAQAPELEADVERMHRFRIPVGEERKVEVERLGPGDVRPRRVARDARREDACLLELLTPVTQELQLTRSGR